VTLCNNFNFSANQTISIALSFNSTDSPFKIPSNFSYHCNREQVLNATSDIKNERFVVLSKVQFEAFKNDNTKKFSLAKDCDSNIKPDIVPIAVGLSLIALIIIVLIAFIVGRRRSQARGYLNIM
jgi:lysosomal-associated membrane protein 1/2